MRLFIKVYADDLRSAATTSPLVLRHPIKGSGTSMLQEMTLGMLKKEIEA